VESTHEFLRGRSPFPPAVDTLGNGVHVFAASSGWLVLGETLDLLSVVGFVVIFGGFVLVKHEALREALLDP